MEVTESDTNNCLAHTKWQVMPIAAGGEMSGIGYQQGLRVRGVECRRYPQEVEKREGRVNSFLNSGKRRVKPTCGLVRE